MSLTPTNNRAGQMYAMTVLTPIVPARLTTLRTVLDNLPTRPSPLAKLAATHFARFVIIDLSKSEVSQPAREDLPAPYLLFSATFDGKLDPYLAQLGDQLADDAAAIWGNCVGAPTLASGPALTEYLKHNQLQTGLFFSAYPNDDVAKVNAALALRRKTIDFATRRQSMTPDELHRAFLQEF